MSNIKDKLKMILEGNTDILLEAEEDKYDLEDNAQPDQGDQSSDEEQNTPATSDTQEDQDQSNEDDSGEQDNQSDDQNEDDGFTNYGLEDDNTDDSDDQDQSSEDTDSDSNEVDSEQQEPEVKEEKILDIDQNARAILAFKNFKKYRELRDDVNQIISELIELVPTDDQTRKYIMVAIEKGTDLVQKLNDYILYKYETNSYEINYKNFMNFLLEKHYLNELYQNIVKMTVKEK